LQLIQKAVQLCLVFLMINANFSLFQVLLKNKSSFTF
jgi:hypothetical protein